MPLDDELFAQTKTCTNCAQPKPLDDFPKGRGVCLECTTARDTESRRVRKNERKREAINKAVRSLNRKKDYITATDLVEELGVKFKGAAGLAQEIHEHYIATKHKDNASKGTLDALKLLTTLVTQTSQMEGDDAYSRMTEEEIGVALEAHFGVASCEPAGFIEEESGSSEDELEDA